jgi:hypothetical protein
MGQSRNKIRILESQLLKGELTMEQFEALRRESMNGQDAEDQVSGTDVGALPLDEDLGDEVEIAAGPDEAELAPQQEASLRSADAPSSVLSPDPSAFDEEEPTDPESGRGADEISDFTLSMVLDTQGEIELDPELMLADDLAELPDDEEEEVEEDDVPAGIFNRERLSEKRAALRDLIQDVPALLRVLLALTAAVCLTLLSLGAVISSLGADEFGCMVAERVNTVGVWQIYYDNLPVGRCSDRAKAVIRAAGIMAPLSDPQEKPSQHKGAAHDDEPPNRTGALHPLEDPKQRTVSLGAATIVDDPSAREVRTPYPSDSLEGLEAPQEEHDNPGSDKGLAPTEVDDIKYCSEAKRVNSVDGWRDYLEHFPLGRCSARATHFLDTRAPAATQVGGVLEQRSTNRGPSDFLIDTIVLNDAAVRRCVRVARGRGRDVPTQMGIHFTIHSEGGVSGSQLVAKELTGTSLDDCIGEQVNLLRFPPWNGRDRTITYTLDLRRRATMPKRRPSPVQDATPDPHEEEEHVAEEEAEGGGGGGH